MSIGDALEGFFGPPATFTGTPRVRQTRIRPEGWEPPAGASRGGGHPQWVGVFEAGSPAWHAARKNGLGGSEIAGAIGISKWLSPFKLWHEKQSHLPPEDPGAPAEWGTRQEPIVLAKFQENHPELRVMPSGTFCHSLRPWQLANPDGLAADQTVVEAKTALYDYAWGPDGSDEIPLYYRAQVTWYMDVMGVDVAWVCVLIGGFDYREYEIAYDLADALYLREQGQAFMKSLVDGVEPPIAEHTEAFAETQSAMEHLHPDIDDRLDVQVDPELAARYEAAERLMRGAKEAKALAAAEMIRAMGRARRAKVGEQVVATRLPRRGGGPAYVKINPGLLATQAAPVKAEADAMRDISAVLVHDARTFRERLAACTTREEVVALVLPSDDINRDDRMFAQTRWRELPPAHA